MRTLSLLALVLIATAGTAQAQSWREVRSAEGRFTAKFPGQPQQKTQPMRVGGGNLTARLFLVELPGVAFYAVAWVDYPRDRIAGKNADQLLDGARDGAIGNVGGKLASEQKITVGGWPARELRVEGIRGDMILVGRLVMAQDRLYQALVVVPRAKESAGSVKPFFDGFTVAGK